jgi:adenylate cyclase
MRSPRWLRRPGAFRAALLVALIPGVAGILLAHWPPAENWEYGGLDLLFLLRGPRPAPKEVCVVALDEDSYQVLGLDPVSPWPRKVHAELIRTLRREGARAVAFDVRFEGARDPEQDAALASALKEAGNVVLGSAVEQVADPRFRQAQIVDPYPPFASAAAMLGDVTFPPDRDGVIRKTWLVHLERDSLALAAYETATSDRSRRSSVERLIDYYGPSRTIRTVSLYQALDPKQYLPPGFFKGKIVFVGLSESSASGPAAKDAFMTPFRGAGGDQTYGVEIHATLGANLLEGRRIGLLAPVSEALLLLLLPTLASLIFMTLRPLMGGFALLVLEIVPWAMGHLAFTRGHVWVPVVIPAAIQLPAAFMISLVWYYVTTVRERERIKKAFSFYLSPEMIRQITADPGALNLGGEEVVATAMFTDIKGFTPIAEGLTAPQTAALLNDYFSDVTRHIFEENGTLIKYIGDAVFAIWGAPLRREDHAEAACRAALALARSQEEPSAASGSGKSLVTRIGVHTGPMLVGNLGSAQRFDYTAIGDAVNLASRLEGLNKPLGTRALVSAESLARTGGKFVTRPLGKARVVGRSEPVEIHELLGLAGETLPMGAEALERFEEARRHFASRRFPEAAEEFREVREMRGGSDGPSEFYLHLIEKLEKDPPPAGWDGVVTFESK